MGCNHLGLWMKFALSFLVPAGINSQDDIIIKFKDVYAYKGRPINIEASYVSAEPVTLFIWAKKTKQGEVEKILSFECQRQTSKTSEKQDATGVFSSRSAPFCTDGSSILSIKSPGEEYFNVVEIRLYLHRSSNDTNTFERVKFHLLEAPITECYVLGELHLMCICKIKGSLHNLKMYFTGYGGVTQNCDIFRKTERNTTVIPVFDFYCKIGVRKNELFQLQVEYLEKTYQKVEHRAKCDTREYTTTARPQTTTTTKGPVTTSLPQTTTTTTKVLITTSLPPTTTTTKGHVTTFPLLTTSVSNEEIIIDEDEFFNKEDKKNLIIITAAIVPGVFLCLLCYLCNKYCYDCVGLISTDKSDKDVRDKLRHSTRGHQPRYNYMKSKNHYTGYKHRPSHTVLPASSKKQVQNTSKISQNSSSLNSTNDKIHRPSKRKRDGKERARGSIFGLKAQHLKNARSYLYKMMTSTKSAERRKRLLRQRRTIAMHETKL